MPPPCVGGPTPVPLRGPAAGHRASTSIPSCLFAFTLVRIYLHTYISLRTFTTGVDHQVREMVMRTTWSRPTED